MVIQDLSFPAFLHRDALPVRAFSNSSSSMLPTLAVGDRIVGDMRAYADKGPDAGGVVLMRRPDDPSIPYVKRVVGLPGDNVRLAGGVLYINGHEVKRELVDHVSDHGVDYTRYRETLPNGVSYDVLDRGPGQMGDDTLTFDVPEDAYFVLGDNRDNSNDSRFLAFSSGFGYVARADILGKASWIYWSADLSRIGKVVE